MMESKNSLCFKQYDGTGTRDTASQIRMGIDFAKGKDKSICTMFQVGIDGLITHIYDLNMKPIHIDVTRKGQWIRTKTGRYKMPLGFDPNAEFEINYVNPVKVVK